MKILIINGPNLNLIGTRETSIYGNQSFDDYFLTLKSTSDLELHYLQSNVEGELINFLQEDLAISAASLAVALRNRDQDPGSLTMTLWQYGLITLEQLEQIYDWLETA